MRKFLGGAVVAAVCVSAFALGAASPAKAFPITVCSPTGCATYCRIVLPNGVVVDLTEGSTFVVTNPNGTRATFTCKNGATVPVKGSVLPSFIIGVISGLVNGGTVTVACQTARGTPCGLTGTFDLRNGWVATLLTG